MIKKFVFLSLIAFSFQIDNCLDTSKRCSACKEGYTFLDYDYYGACVKSDTVILGDSNSGCLFYYPNSKNYCAQCKRGYLMDYISNECKKVPENCQEMDSNYKCIKCNHYYKLTDDKQCEKTSCYEFNNGKCECEEEYYLYEEKECRKIPVFFCLEWDVASSSCKVCYEGTTKDGKGGCKFEGNYYDYDDDEYDDDDDEEENKGIPNCVSYDDYNTKAKCTLCETNYELSSNQKECLYLCTKTEEYCDDCKDNFFKTDWGKTCEIIDPYYKEDNSDLINMNLACLAMILIFIL